MVDRFIFKGVRDVFFLPFADLGTFNFADVCIIFGSIGFVVSAVTFSLIEIYKEKRKKSISEDSENELDENENNESTKTEKNVETNEQSKSDTFNNSEINEEKPISKEYPVGLYHGCIEFPYNKEYLTWLKIGRYIECQGGLASPTTNQKMLYKLPNGEWTNITPFFTKETNG